MCHVLIRRASQTDGAVVDLARLKITFGKREPDAEMLPGLDKGHAAVQLIDYRQATLDLWPVKGFRTL